MYLRCLVGFAGIRRKAARHLADERAALCGHSRRIRRNVIIVINVIVLFAVIVVGVMHVCDRARGDCKRSPACTVYGDGNATASLRINMLARQNDTDFCGVYINDVSYSANLVSFSQSDWDVSTSWENNTEKRLPATTTTEQNRKKKSTNEIGKATRDKD